MRALLQNLCIVAATVLTATSFAHASQFAEPDTATIERCMAQMTQENWRLRRNAVHQLIEIGPPVEALLRDQLAKNPSPEFRLRANDVLRRVDPMRRIEPALISLDFANADATTALDRLARIEGAPLPADPPTLLDQIAERITAHFDHRPYWEIVLEICRQADLRLRCNESGVVLVRPKKPLPPRRFAVSGMFLVTPTWMPGFKEIGPGMRISVYAEPRARILRGDSPFTLTEAVDTAGRSCLSESSLNAGGMSITNGYSWSAGLASAVVPGSTLVRCRGTARVIAAETFQILDVPGVASSKSLADPMPIRLSAGGVSASIVRIIKAGDEYQMDIQIYTDPAEVDWNALMFSVRSGGMKAFDVQGRELSLNAVLSDGAGPSNLLRCRWGIGAKRSKVSAGEPFSLKWQIPARTIRLAVPFELNDVILK